MIALVLSAAFVVACSVESQSQYQGDLDLLRQAEAAFQGGLTAKADTSAAIAQFEKAASAYDELYDRGIRSPELFRNLGNAKILSGKLGEAVWAWRLGLQLAPNDDTLREQLDWARQRVAERQMKPIVAMDSPWREILSRLSPQGMFLGLLICFALLCLCWTRWWMVRAFRWIVLSMVFGVGILAFAWLLIEKQASEHDRVQRPFVVVTVSQTDFRRGNGTAYPSVPDVPILHEGTEGRLLYEHDGWRQIELPSGQVGWVSASAVRIGRL